MKRLSLAVSFLLLATSNLVSAADAREKPLFDVHESTLKNGMRVVTLEDFSCPIAAVQVWYGVGSKDEQPDRQGYAHMFEHMMFKGTDRASSKDYFDLVFKTGGSSNAYTSYDETVYVQTLPADQIEMVLWLEAERMAFLKIDQQNFDTERNVVLEELRMGENEPYGTLFKKLAAFVFKEHPYRWTTIGNIAHLRATSVPDLRAFWNKYYVPNNAVLVVVGAVKHEDVVKLADTYFGWIQKRNDPPRVTIREPKPTESKSITIDDENAPAPVCGYIFRTVPLAHKDEIALDFLAEILGGNTSSRLYRDLVADKQLAIQSLATTYNLQQDGVFLVGALQAPGAEAKTILDAVKKHIEAIQKDGVTDRELQTARNQKLCSAVTENLTIDSKARIIGTSSLIVGDLNYANGVFDRIRSVTAADIQRVAKEYLRFDRDFEVVVKQNTTNIAKDDETSAVTAKPETETPPAGKPGEKRPGDFPLKAPIARQQVPNLKINYSEDKLANGMKVIVVPNHEVPFITVKLGITDGAISETKPGTANMTLQMLTRGTRTRTEKDLSDQLSLYAISLGGSADMDKCEVNLGCLTEYAQTGMELLADVVLNPVFDAAEFEKLRKQTLASLQINEQNPEYLANKELSKKLFGTHPYARTLEGESGDIKALSREDMAQWWSQSARPDNATLIFAGDITSDKAMALAKAAFDKWTAAAATQKPDLPALPKEEKTRIFIVDKPGNAQVQIRIGCRSITRKDQPDYFTSRVLSNYFGGSFNSWLNGTLREEQGLTYGISGQYATYLKAGYFAISTFTKNETSGRMVQGILDLIKKVREVKPSADELGMSQSYITGSFIRRRETPQQNAGDLWLIESEKLGKDYYDNLLKQVQATTAEDCTALACKTLPLDKLTIIVVGDASRIKDQLEKIAPVMIITQENQQAR